MVTSKQVVLLALGIIVLIVAYAGIAAYLQGNLRGRTLELQEALEDYERR